MPRRELTPRQRLFVLEYMLDFDADAAHMRLGANPEDRIQEEPGVSAEIMRQTQLLEAQTDTDITAEGMIAKLLNNAGAATRSGNYAAANTAYKIVAQLKGYLGEKKRDPEETDPLKSMGFGSPTP